MSLDILDGNGVSKKLKTQEDNDNIHTPVHACRIADLGNLDAFHRLRVSEPYTIFDSKQISNQHENIFWDTSEVSGGGTSSTYNQNKAQTSLSVSNTTAGKRVRQTKQRFNYQPGKSQLVFITFAGNTLVSGVKKEVGLFDDNNGLFLSIDGSSASLVRRTKASGSVVDNSISQASWNLDTMDGNCPSGITLDFSKSQILLIDYEWLGVGRVRYGFVVDGIPVYVHQELNTNNLDVVYMSTPNLPVRYSIENDGTGSAAEFDCICSSVISEGSFEPNGVNRVVFNTSKVNANTIGTKYAMLGIKLKTNSQGALIVPEGISLLATTADAFRWELHVNPTVAGTFTYNDLTDSAIQYALADTSSPSTNTISSDGTILYSGLVSDKTRNVNLPLKSAYRLGVDIAGNEDELVLVVVPIGASLDVYSSLNFREII